MTSIPQTTLGVNAPSTDVSRMTETEWFDVWSDADMRTRRHNGVTVTEWVARDIWEVLDPVDGFEYASPSDCSCRGLYPNERPANLPPCVHMQVVVAFLDSLDNPSDDHDGYMTATMP